MQQTERNHRENRIGKNMAAEVAGSPLVRDCSLALPSPERKPKPPACYRGTTRLQLRSTLKRIFKCLLINWALWCAASVCSLHVFWCPCQMILWVCTVSQLVVCAWYLCVEISTCLQCCLRPPIFVKFIPHVVCLQNGMTRRHDLPTERAADNPHIDSVIICHAR